MDRIDDILFLYEDDKVEMADGGPITANKIPLKPVNKNINKKGQPDTTIVKMAVGGAVKAIAKRILKGKKKYDYKDPKQKNQYIMRSDKEIQKIIDDPKYKDYRRKDFRNEGLLTRKETEREGLKFKNFGKRKDPEKVRKSQEKRTGQTKKKSSVTLEQKLAAPKKSGLELSHLGSKKEKVTTGNLAYLPKDINKLSYQRFERILNDIQAKQQKIIANKKMPIPEKRKKLGELARADRALRSKFRGLGYQNIKSRISVRPSELSPSGMMMKEVIRDPSITIGRGQPGASIALRKATPDQRERILGLGLESLKNVRGGFRRGGYLAQGAKDLYKYMISPEGQRDTGYFGGLEGLNEIYKLLNLPGLFADGGIANLPGAKSGPPPESGPNPQGLENVKYYVTNT
jgi:hypothetical protein